MKKKAKNIVIWGLGSHAKNNLIPAILDSDQITLYGIFSRNSQTVSQISGEYKCSSWNDSNDMLADPLIDAIILSTPPGLHFDQGMKILASGKHLWCEKPLTTNLSETLQLVNFAEKKNLAVCESLMYQYHPQFIELKKMIRKNHLGAISIIQSNFCLPTLDNPGFRDNQLLGASCLMDVGIYPISLILSLFDNNSIEVVTSKIIINDELSYDVSGITHLLIDSNINCFLNWSYDTAYTNEVNIWGTKNSLHSNRIFSKNKEYTPYFEMRDMNGNYSKTELPSANHFKWMLDYFSKVIDSEEKINQQKSNILKLATILEKIKVN